MLSFPRTVRKKIFIINQPLGQLYHKLLAHPAAFLRKESQFNQTVKANQNNTNKLRSKQANKHKQITNEQTGKWQKREQANKQTTNQSNKQMKKLGFVSLLGGKALVLLSKRANDL